MFVTAMDWIHYKPVWTQLSPRKSLFIVNWRHLISLLLFHIWKVGPSPHRHTQARATRINNLTHDVYCHIYKIFLIPNWNWKETWLLTKKIHLQKLNILNYKLNSNFHYFENISNRFFDLNGNRKRNTTPNLQ